uniref:G_PROTEIN_RECEP_F3_4 domain-containing protein n=1 Tax=Globodera pallida TaxID=36090 RepID=A0A183CNZ2_GLOPA
LEQDGVQVIYTASLSSEHGEETIGSELEELKKRDLHIIVADLAEQLALRVLCAAFQHGLYGADFVWILPSFQSSPDGSVRAQWWRTKKTTTASLMPNCSEAQLLHVLEGHFALEHVRIRPYSNDARLVSGKTVRQVLREFRQVCAERDSRHECRDELAHSAYAYDGIWALGLALNRTLAAEEQRSDSDFRRRAHRLVEAMRDTDFQGLSGRVRFDDSGERLGIVQILQWSNGSYSALGYHDSAEEQFYLRKSAHWTPPLDSTLVHRRRQHVSATLSIAMCSLALAGICLALGFFVVNVKYRNHRFIKMSSPNMNNLIICGSLCAYLSVFLLSIDTRLVNERTFERICYAKAWILCTGFTLAFGSMFSKTWRVHSIFTVTLLFVQFDAVGPSPQNIRRDKKAIRDSKLYLIVAALLAVDGAVLLSWTLVSPFRMAISEQGKFLEKNWLIVPEFERCESAHSLTFQVVFFLFKGMLMVVELWQAPRGTEHHRLRKGMMKSMVGTGGAGSGGRSGGGCRHTQLPIGDSKLSTSTAPAAVGAGAYTPSKASPLCRQLSLLSAQELCRRSAALETDNLRLHQSLISKSTELWDLLERVRLLTVKLREMEIARRNSSKKLLMAAGNASKPSPKALCVVKLDAHGGTDGESLARRCSARILSTVAHQ